MTKIHDPKLIKSAAGTVNAPKALKNSGFAGPGKLAVSSKPQANVAVSTNKKEVSTDNNKKTGEFYNSDTVKTSVVPENAKKIEAVKGLPINREKSSFSIGRWWNNLTQPTEAVDKNKEIINYVKNVEDVLPKNFEPLSAENLAILWSPHNVRDLPESPMKPVKYTQDEYTSAAVVLTGVKLIEKGAPREQVLMLVSTFRGNPGNNISLMQRLSRILKRFNEHVNMLKSINPELSNNMDEALRKKLTVIVPAQNLMVPQEIIVYTKYNLQQNEQLVFNYDQSVKNKFWCYNNSPNSCPDYTLPLIEPVKVDYEIYTEMALECKLRKSNLENFDIIKGCSDDLPKHTLMAQNSVIQQLRALNHKTLSLEDRKLIQHIINDLEENQKSFTMHQNAEKFAIDFNNFRYTHGHFFIRHKIAINMPIHLKYSDGLVDNTLKEEFINGIIEFGYSPNSEWIQFLNKKIAENNNIKLNIADLVEEFVSLKFPGAVN